MAMAVEFDVGDLIRLIETKPDDNYKQYETEEVGGDSFTVFFLEKKAKYF